MPIRSALILIGLLVVCIGIVLSAWHFGVDFYLLLPSRRFVAVAKPPTHPATILVCIAACLAIFIYSQRYGLIIFSIFVGGLILGSIVGPWVFDWKLSTAQILLTLTAVVEASYGWVLNATYFDY